MDELSIQRHDFENAKNEIKKFAKNTPANIEIKKFETTGGLFNWFDHKVTGDEMNDFATEIEKLFISLNNRDKDFIKQFDEVYKAFESLDKDYIQAIIISVKSAEKASQEAKNAQKDINKTIDALSKTINILNKFKTRIDKINHLSDVDDMWLYIENIIKELSFYNTETDNRISSLKKDINALNQFKNKLSVYKHLNDIDNMWLYLENLIGELSSYSTKTDKTINFLTKDINVLNQFKDKLSVYKHLDDIDSMWSYLESVIGELSSYSTKTDKTINFLKKDINVLNQFKNKLSICKHLDDIDSMWSYLENVIGELSSYSIKTDRTISSLTKDINILNQFKNKLVTYKHLSDIDIIWEDIEFIKKKTKEYYEIYTTTTGALSRDVETLNKKVQNLKDKVQEMEESKKYIDTLKGYTHINEIDEEWEYSHGLEKTINAISDRSKEQEEKLKNLNDSVFEIKNRYEVENKTLGRKLIISYFIAGGSLVLVILQIILNLIGVL